MADVLTSEVDENFHLSTWDRDILYADRSSEDEQLLIRLFLRKTKSTNHGGLSKRKIHISFYGDNS
jgi:hypothetical protein